MKRRWTVQDSTTGKDRDAGMRTFWVRDAKPGPGPNPRPAGRVAAEVWVSQGDVPRCAECSSIQVAMLATCPHALAVKRHLEKLGEL